MGDVATTLVACGLRREAGILAGAGISTIAGGGDADRLDAMLVAAAPGARRIVSAGLAGALDPTLRIGDIVLATQVQTSSDPPDAAPLPPKATSELQQLLALLPDARTGSIYADGMAVGSAAAKAALFARTGAIAIDMESHVAARVAARHGLPFLAVRVVSDTAADTLPPAALVGMAPDGGMAILPVLASLMRNPSQLPALLRTARAAETAFARLRRVHHALVGAGIGGPDLGELPLDM